MRFHDFLVALRAPKRMDTGQDDHEVDPGCREGLCSREGVDVEPGLKDERASGFEAAVDVAGGVESEMTDLTEAWRQSVHEKASDELLGHE